MFPLRDGAASIIFVPQRVTSSVSLYATINEIRALPNHIQLTPLQPTATGFRSEPRSHEIVLAVADLMTVLALRNAFSPLRRQPRVMSYDLCNPRIVG